MFHLKYCNMNTQVKVVVRGLIAETNINIMNKINNESRYWHDIKGTTKSGNHVKI